MKPLLAPVLAFLALTAVFASPALAQMDVSKMRTITVSGESSEQFSPDQAVLSVSLVSRDKNLTAAKKHNDELTEKLVNIAREYKIAKEKISTSHLYIAPEYHYNNKENKQEFAGYTVNRSLRIVMDDLTTHERLLSSIVEAKVDQVNGIEFRLANPEAHAAGLRIKAFENAKSKAAALAQAAGSRLGQALIITTVDMNTPIHPPRPMMMQAKMADAAEMSVAPSLPGMVELHQSVTVVFGME